MKRAPEKIGRKPEKRSSFGYEGARQMLGLRPYKKEDAATIISWSKDERLFISGVPGSWGNTLLHRRNSDLLIP